MTDAKYLLDANICIHILDNASSEAVRRLEQCEVGEAVTSSIVYAEVMLARLERDGYARAGAASSSCCRCCRSMMRQPMRMRGSLSNGSRSIA